MGKTSFAEAIAEALGLPFFVVRYDALIGSYLGETNTRLRSCLTMCGRGLAFFSLTSSTRLARSAVTPMKRVRSKE